MGESKLSPAPWTCGGPGDPVRDANGAVIALVYPEDSLRRRWYWECGMANHHLIAAAPELLRALEVAERVLVEQETELRQLGAEYPDAESAILTAQEAIAKARGET